ncbi:MAG: DUF2914 domain-containing protein [Candidatus Pacebacteria bacterium]|nr:DUF2914 domain-containing protein [Candidatus Paceibacterota bacterium]MDD5356903.1 DUF2914 domain-containing protein [Candidatus Paceibacterota bacterium]
MHLHRITHTLEKYERHISSGMLVFGFIFDSLTLTRIDKSRDHIILAFYLLLVLLCIFFVNLFEERQLKAGFLEKAQPWLLFAIQFSFGGLFSNFIILYARSASFLSSWPFLLLLFGLLVGNEFFKRHYARFAFHMSVFFVALFSFLIFFIPVVLKQMSGSIFFLSGLTTVVLFLFVMYELSRFFPERIEDSKRTLTFSISIIFLLINVLYITNIIPPIPLSLKEIGVFHSIYRKSSTEFIVLSEEQKGYAFLRSSDTVSLKEGEPAYVLSAVFAPTGLSVKIIHDWQYYDEKEGWVSSAKIPLTVVGGREGGYRVYSKKENISPGLWRVNVETERGQVVGKMKFLVERVTTSPQLESSLR